MFDAKETLAKAFQFRPHIQKTWIGAINTANSIAIAAISPDQFRAFKRLTPESGGLPGVEN